MEHIHDVIIIGAGAAGIGCAHRLSQHNIDFQILEARSRSGGRVYSIVEPGLTTPIELGAEFVHGAPAKIMALMQNLKFPFYDVKDEHLFLQNDKLISAKNFGHQMEIVMSHLHPERKHDRPINDFIKAQHMDNATKDNFISYIEGFQAADTLLLGEQGLADLNQQDDSLNGSKMFRPLLRYDSLLQKILDRYVKKDTLQLNTELKRIHWEKNNVELICYQGPSQIEKIYRCKKLVLTVPLGVLHSSALQWNRIPEDLALGLDSVYMGHVQRIVFRFRYRFWENLSDQPTAFFHCGPDSYFPTWWSLQPLRTPHLVAWQGGPKAIEMSTWSEEERLQTALKTLSTMMGLSTEFLNSELESWHTHNWSKDPFTRGAYSYIAVGGVEKARRLQKGFDGTIFLAGEHTMMGSGRGTVHGAFDSGWNTADQVMKKTSRTVAELDL